MVSEPVEPPSCLRPQDSTQKITDARGTKGGLTPIGGGRWGSKKNQGAISKKKKKWGPKKSRKKEKPDAKKKYCSGRTSYMQKWTPKKKAKRATKKKKKKTRIPYKTKSPRNTSEYQIPLRGEDNVEKPRY